MTIDFANIVYTSAALLVFSALANKRIIVLRITYLIASLTFATYGIIMGIPIIVFWNSITSIINGIRIFLYFIDTIPWFIYGTDLILFNNFFKNFMQPGEFRKFIKLSETKTYQDTVIFSEGSMNQGVYFVIELHGRLLVEKSNALLKELHEHSFFGEMSFIRNKPTSASIRLEGSMTCYHWRYEQLQQLKKKHSDVFNVFTLILSHDLVTKLEG